jgi:hypothetical protein
MDSGNGQKRLSYKTVLFTILIFCGLVLLFALFGVFLAPASAKLGGTRPADTMPGHLLELAGFGLLLGAVLVAIYGREGFPLVPLMPVLIVALDLDHLPAYLGIAQTIRPAHSAVFIITVLAITAITIKRLEVDLVVLSATLAHLGIDTGVFAPFSPVSFDYYQLDPYRVPFLVCAILTAIVAGFVMKRRRSGTQSMRGELTEGASP